MALPFIDINNKNIEDCYNNNIKNKTFTWEVYYDTNTYAIINVTETIIVTFGNIQYLVLINGSIIDIKNPQNLDGKNVIVTLSSC